MALEMTDLYWAAGFMEGEASFSRTVQVYQVQKEPLERIQRIFGAGKISWRAHKKGIWAWYCNTRESAAIAMTIYTIMSPRRKQQIEVMLERWKSARVPSTKERPVCNKGHRVEGDNLLVFRGARRCRQCFNPDIYRMSPETIRSYYLKNRTKILAAQKLRYASDPELRAKISLRGKEKWAAKKASQSANAAERDH